MSFDRKNPTRIIFYDPPKPRMYDVVPCGSDPIDEDMPVVCEDVKGPDAATVMIISAAAIVAGIICGTLAAILIIGSVK